MHRSLLCFSIIASLFCSCSRNSRNVSTMASDPVITNGSAETTSSPANYEPAFPGQTRIAAVKTKTTYAVSIITDKLDRPWGIAKLPDGRFLVSEKRGAMRIVSASGQISSPIAGVPAVNSGGQGGLLGLTLDPNFSANRMIYWSFSEANKGGNLTAVAKASLSADEKYLENVTVIYRATPAYNGVLHYGSRVIFDKTGNLMISTGERSDLQTRPQAQELNSSLGKIIRITTAGEPAPGNPFIGMAGARAEIYSYGHRNVHGLAMHPVTGDIWENEFGPRGGDELNLLRPGVNYGWPIITYGKEYSGEKVGAGITQQAGLEQPVYYWDPWAVPEWHVLLFGK